METPTAQGPGTFPRLALVDVPAVLLVLLCVLSLAARVLLLLGR